jgi:hypothetical protein
MRCGTCGVDPHDRTSGTCDCGLAPTVINYGCVKVRPFKCPVCDGAGQVSRPPWVPGDADNWGGTAIASYKCHACDGTGVVWGPP